MTGAKHKIGISKLCTWMCVLMAIAMAACTAQEHDADVIVNHYPTIFPDYTDVTVAPNMVAPRFWIQDSDKIEDAQAVFSAGPIRYVENAKNRCITISKESWDQLCNSSDAVNVRVLVKKDGRWTEYVPFPINIAPDSIDKFIAYRLIEPGYETWNEMGIYQRCLENFKAVSIITNRQTDYGCMNCHSFHQQNPNRMLLHLRRDHAGTYLIEDGEIRKLNTKTPETISALVYPSWHPSGRYVAFSTNDTKQMFHTSSPNRIEVFDYASDVVVYDKETDEIVSSPLLMSTSSFETFPTFSADGRRLYFCTADSVEIPKDYMEALYSICAIAYDPDTRTFGTEVDTLYNAKAQGRSASFPRVSPDGRFLMFTVSDYGNFSIWHRDADLYMVDLNTGAYYPLDAVNSDETESYHSWSNNGRWVVFSSRRLDGLYTRPYFTYIDTAGNAHKPIIMPPATENYYQRVMKSYNVPEFIKGPVTVSGYDISQVAKNSKGTDLKFVN